MITRIEALRFRCLNFVDQRLNGFQVLVGPNASGKTTFLDVIAFLSTLISEGLDRAVGDRTEDFRDLLWLREGNGFELAVEARVPDEIRLAGSKSVFDRVRYEIGIGRDSSDGAVAITHENLRLKTEEAKPGLLQRDFFPSIRQAPSSIFLPKGAKNTRQVVSKVPNGNDNFQTEKPADSKESKKRGWVHSFKLGPRRSALANLPEIARIPRRWFFDSNPSTASFCVPSAASTTRSFFPPMPLIPKSRKPTDVPTCRRSSTPEAVDARCLKRYPSPRSH